MIDHVQTIVVGAGVVGLAIARRLAPGAEGLIIMERGHTIGSQTSSRNSEVIHAGMYYSARSLKAYSCVTGRRRLYDYCRDHGVEHRRVGKLIVATEPGHLNALRSIIERAAVNGLSTPDDALHLLDAEAVRAVEPELRCLAALWSPSTGIIDTHALMLAYQSDAERAGALLSLNTVFVDARREGGAWYVRTTGVDGDFEISCTHLVNAAGLQAQQVARRIAGLAPRHVPQAIWVKGNYFSVAGARPPFRHLIYPVPGGGGLGVHLTIDLSGHARFGPDTELISAETEHPDYSVHPQRADAFYAAIRSYWPTLADGALQPAYAGIRPKIRRNGSTLDTNDFEISGFAQHGLPGLVNLFGIESPGITASLVLADLVAQNLQPR